MELLLVLPLLVIVVVAAMQVVGLARARLEIQAAARDGARVAATTPDPARAVEAALASLSPALRDRARVSVERPARVGASARVVVTLRHSLGAPFPSVFALDLTASSAMPVEQ